MANKTSRLERSKPSTGFGQATAASAALESGEIIGQTLVLTNEDGSTVNVPLTGIEQAINFSNLSAIQKQAIQDCVKGDLVCDAFNNELGNLV